MSLRTGVYSVVTPADFEPVSLDEAKEHLRVDVTDDDALITHIVAAARSYCENYVRRTLITTTYDAYYDAFGTLILPKPPVASVTSVSYLDEDSATQVVTSTIYNTNTTEGIIRLGYNQDWPSDKQSFPNSVIVRYVAGYGDPDDVPRDLIAGMFLIIGELYEQREESIAGVGVAVAPTVLAAKLLWDPYRVAVF